MQHAGCLGHLPECPALTRSCCAAAPPKTIAREAKEDSETRSLWVAPPVASPEISYCPRPATRSRRIDARPPGPIRSGTRRQRSRQEWGRRAESLESGKGRDGFLETPTGRCQRRHPQAPRVKAHTACENCRISTTEKASPRSQSSSRTRPAVTFSHQIQHLRGLLFLLLFGG